MCACDESTCHHGLWAPIARTPRHLADLKETLGRTSPKSAWDKVPLLTACSFPVCFYLEEPWKNALPRTNIFFPRKMVFSVQKSYQPKFLSCLFLFNGSKMVRCHWWKCYTLTSNSTYCTFAVCVGTLDEQNKLPCTACSFTLGTLRLYFGRRKWCPLLLQPGVDPGERATASIFLFGQLFFCYACACWLLYSLCLSVLSFFDKQ